MKKIIFSIDFELSFVVKRHLKCVDEIASENGEHQSVITKSVSTPASLQAIVRFQSGSNMSLQHKVSEIPQKVKSIKSPAVN